MLSDRGFALEKATKEQLRDKGWERRAVSEKAKGKAAGAGKRETHLEKEAPRDTCRDKQAEIKKVERNE